jgi:hypothetical protein
MKNFYLIAVLILAFSLTFVGCTDEPDDIDNTPPSSYFKYNGQYFELSKGFFTSLGTVEISRSYELYLTGPKVTFDTNTNYLTGTDMGLIIRFYLPLNTTTFPVNNFPNVNYDIQENTFSLITYDTNFNFSGYSGMHLFDYKNDTISVTKTGNLYNLDYKGYDSNMNPFEIKYKGPINFVEMDH